MLDQFRQSLPGRARATARLALDVVFPPECAFCFAPLGVQRPASGLCEPCEGKVPWLTGTLCIRCGHPMPEPFEDDEADEKNRDSLCGLCLKDHPRYHQARAACRYGDPVREAVLALKYGRRLELTGPLTTLLRCAFDDAYPPGEARPNLVTAVPLHPVRLRLRHFDQARLLCTRLASEVQTLAAPDLLRRVRDTSSQRGLSRTQRRENVRGAFSLRKAPCAGAHVLLIDDVYTTGATVNECAKVLLKQGKAARVDVLCVARAVKA